MRYTVGALVRARAAQDPERVAIRSEDRAVTWKELYQQACRVANALAKSGVRAQDRVSLIDRNGIEHFEFIFGCAVLNAIPVPINWRLSPPEIVQTLLDAESRVLLVGPDYQAVIESVEGGLDPSMRIVSLTGKHARWTAYDEWCGSASTLDPVTEPQPGDVALHFYSSGTTGKPKGILWSVENTEFLLRDTSVSYGVKRDDVSLLTMPLFHSGGTGWALCGMMNGCVSITVRQFEANTILQVIEQQKVTVAMFVPAMLAALCKAPHAREKVKSCRQINYTGSPISESALTDAMEIFGCAFIQNYGLAETTGGFAQLDAEDHDPGGPRRGLLRSVGKAYPGIEVKIVDVSSGTELRAGQIGELWTRSGQNMPGYWKNAAETAKTITSDNWLKTGDGGYIDPEGYIFLTDRLKDVIITGGENVYPTEVENVLGAHPAVAECAVIGIPSERWGETVKGIVVLEAASSASAEELLSYCATLLAGYKRPTSVDFVDMLPRNPTGKLLKTALREPYWRHHGRGIA